MKSKLEVGDVKIFTLNSMLEVIGKVVEVNDDYCKVSQALMIRLEPQEGPDGRPALSAALGPLSMFIEKDEKSQGADINLYYNVMLGASDPQEGILEYYSNLTGSIMAPPAKKIQMPT
jgi:hypothetical protein